MSNEYFAVSGSPATSSQGASATIRSEFTSIAAGFDKLPTLSGNGSKLVQINSGGTAMAAISLTVGALLFGGAAGVLGQDGGNLFWDNTAKRLGIGNAAPTVALDVTGAIKTSTTLTASTSVVTPVLAAGAGINLQFGGGATGDWVGDQSTKALRPLVANDNAIDFGDPTARVRKVFTPIIDTGTTGSGALKTNNGTTVLTWANTGAVGWGTGIANFGTITKRKTADESVTSSTVLQDDDHLTFAIAANEEWVGYFNIAAGSSLNGTGAKTALNAPSGATIQFDGLAVTNNAGVTTGGTTTVIGTAIDFSAANLTPSSAGTFGFRFWILNGATPGNVTLQWAQSSSSVSPLIYKKGSSMQATRVA